MQAGLEDYLFENDIPFAQQTILGKLLGSALTQWLIAQIAGGSPLAAATALLAKLVPALCWQTLYLALPALHLRITAKGLVSQNGNDSLIKSAQLKELEYMRSRALERADGYAADTLSFLRENASDYPGWTDPGTASAQSIGLYIPPEGVV